MLRSTVYPGVTAVVERLVARLGLDVDVAFCPERIAEGKALEELGRAAPDRRRRAPTASLERATKLFRNLTDEVVYLEPEEAELAKLFTNAWRYIKFAAANQLFMMANDFGLDYERIRAGGAPQLPACRRPPRCRVRRGPVPVQGHDAAGRVQQQQLQPRSGERHHQRGLAALRGRPPRAALRPPAHRRWASSAWRSRASPTTSAPA